MSSFCASGCSTPPTRGNLCEKCYQEMVVALTGEGRRPAWGDVFEQEIRDGLTACGCSHDHLDLEECVAFLVKLARRGAAIDRRGCQ